MRDGREGARRARAGQEAFHLQTAKPGQGGRGVRAIEHKLLRCHAPFPVWPLNESREAGRWVGALLSNLYGAFPALRYGSGRSSLEKPNRWLFADLRSTALHPRRCSCPLVGAPAVASAGAGEPRTRARASDDNLQPRFRHATGPAPPPSLIPGAHQVPVRAVTAIMRAAGRTGMKESLTNASSH